MLSQDSVLYNLQTITNNFIQATIINENNITQ